MWDQSWRELVHTHLLDPLTPTYLPLRLLGGRQLESVRGRSAAGALPGESRGFFLIVFFGVSEEMIMQ